MLACLVAKVTPRQKRCGRAADNRESKEIGLPQPPRTRNSALFVDAERDERRDVNDQYDESGEQEHPTILPV